MAQFSTLLQKYFVQVTSSCTESHAVYHCCGVPSLYNPLICAITYCTPLEAIHNLSPFTSNIYILDFDSGSNCSVAKFWHNVADRGRCILCIWKNSHVCGTLMSEMMRRCAEWSDASWGFLCTIVDGFHFLCVFSAGDWTWTRNCPVHNWSRTLNLFHHHCLCLCAEEETRKGEKIIKIIRSSLPSENENTIKHKLCTR